MGWKFLAILIQDIIKVHFALLRAIDLTMVSGGNGLGMIFLDFKERSVPWWSILVYHCQYCYNISPYCQHLKPLLSWNDLKWRRQRLAVVAQSKKIHHTSRAWLQQPSYFKINPHQSPQPRGLRKKMDLSARVCWFRAEHFLFWVLFLSPVAAVSKINNQIIANVLATLSTMDDRDPDSSKIITPFHLPKDLASCYTVSFFLQVIFEICLSKNYRKRARP